MKFLAGIEKAAGIEIFILQDGSFRISYCLLHKQKKLVSLEKSFSKLESFEYLKPLIDKKTAVVLSICGKGIINKLNVDIANLDNVLAGSDRSDFFIQFAQTNAGQKIVSFSRKSVIESIINQLEDVSVFVEKVFLGPFIIEDVLSKTHSQIIPKLFCCGHQLNEEGEWIILQMTNQDTISEGHSKIKIGEELLDNQLLVAFAGAFITLGGLAINWETHGDEKVAAIKKEFFQKKVLKILVPGILAFFFVILLGNFILYDKLIHDNSVLRSKLSGNETIANDLNKLKMDIENKEHLIKINALNGNTRLSFYADRIFSIMPDAIFLNDVNLNPREVKKTGTDDEILFDNNVIIITGKTKESIALNNWIRKLKSFTWISDVVIDKYKTTVADGLADFILTINLK